MNGGIAKGSEKKKPNTILLGIMMTNLNFKTKKGLYIKLYILHFIQLWFASYDRTVCDYQRHRF